MSFNIYETDDRTTIIQKLHFLKEGQCINLEARIIDDKFPVGMSEWRTPRERLLSNLMGSAYGGFTVDERRSAGYGYIYVICRHACGEKRVYVDPDREHLFDKKPDGSYESITFNPNHESKKL